MKDIKEVSPFEFVKAWQSAKTLDDVSKTLNCDKLALVKRAVRFRNKGLSLKKFTDSKVNVKELNKLIRKIGG